MMEQILIEGYPHLLGEGIPFVKEPFYNVNIGDKISSIGDGRNNGSYKTLDITPFMTYVGSIVLGFPDPDKYYCFLIPAQSITNWGNRKECSVYACISDIGYSDVDGSRYVGRKNMGNRLNFYCYKAVFTKVMNLDLCVESLLI